ncbi:hypothetical protein [Streptomyces griseoflavus]|uniref:hypothetical protein n=1 Tax=Streptomyces griseoflavus TaxID=35619 RepID=UPI0001B4DBF9|nr:hypothetical protein [Streptomyces griseoflavus]
MASITIDLQDFTALMDGNMSRGLHQRLRVAALAKAGLPTDAVVFPTNYDPAELPGRNVKDVLFERVSGYIEAAE